MGKINSKNKGKRGELLLVHAQNDFGLHAERTVQFSGRHPDSSDITTREFPGFYQEMKFTEKLNVQEAFQRACEDCGAKIPIVYHKRKRGPILAILEAEKLWQLLMNPDFRKQFIPLDFEATLHAE